MCSENEKPDRLIRMLYDIADDAEAPANSRLSAIKEILDRTVGKGVRWAQCSVRKVSCAESSIAWSYGDLFCTMQKRSTAKNRKNKKSIKYIVIFALL